MLAESSLPFLSITVSTFFYIDHLSCEEQAEDSGSMLREISPFS